MKRFLSLVLIMIVLVVPAYAEKVEKVGIINYLELSEDGGSYNTIKLELSHLIEEEGSYYIPLRELADLIEGEINWNNEEQKATLIRKDNQVEFIKGEKSVYVNRHKIINNGTGIIDSGQYTLPLENKIIDGKLYVSSNFLGFVFGTINYTPEGFYIKVYK